MRYTRKKRINKSKIYIGGNIPDKCIFIQLLGGLGNQIFIYAAGLLIKNKLKMPLCLIDVKDNIHINPHSNTDYRLELFKQGIPVAYSTVKDRLDKSEKLFNHIKTPHNIWKEANIKRKLDTNIYITDKYFQIYEGIYQAIPLIKAEFKPIFETKYPELKEKFQEKYKNYNQTLSDVSVFMHVRRGDYDINALPSTYYQAALDIIKDNTAIKYINILSDDINWCKTQKWNMHGIVVEFIVNTDEIYVLYLMSLCMAGAIISGSSFSTWGVLLGANNNKKSTIVYPSKWYTGNSNKLKFPHWWKQIKVN